MNGRSRTHAAMAAVLSLIAALGCDKTRACKTGTVLLDLRFASEAQAGDRVDLTIDVTDTPHKTITGSLPLNAGTRGGTAEIDLAPPYRAGAHVTLLARAMRGDEMIEEIASMATLADACSRVVLQNGASTSPDAGQDADSGGGDDGAVDRVYVEVGGDVGVCPGSCSPGQSVPCGKCGSKTCRMDCTWGTCSDEGECLAGSTQACGNCGIQVCDTNCHWQATCQRAGECKPGDTKTCGTCGRQTCSATCSWGACTDDSVCIPGSTRSCGRCGTEMCGNTGATCGWSGVCTGEGACSPGSTRACGTGNCGSESCGNDCKWSGVCQSPGECVPGTVAGCGNCGTRTCGTDCRWPTDPNACTGQGACAAGATAGCGNCGTATCSITCQWSACTGQGACTPGDIIDCGLCGDAIQTCTASCAWGTCRGGTVGCCVQPLTDDPSVAAAPICL